MFNLLEFDDLELEKNFREKQNSSNNVLNRFVFLIGFFFIIGFYLIIFYFSKPQDFNNFLAYVIVTQSIMLIALVLSFLDLPVNIVHFVYFVAIFVVNTSVLISSTMLNGMEFFITYGGFICLLYAGISFLRIFFRYALLFVIFMIISYEIIIISNFSISDYYIILIQYVFFCTLFISIAANYNLEKRERNNFIKLQIIVAERLEHSGISNQVLGDE